MHSHRMDGEDMDGKGDAFDNTRRRVAVAVAAEKAHAPFGQELERSRMQAGARLCCIPWPEFSSSVPVTDTHEQKIAGTDADVVLLLGGYKIVDRHTIA